MFEMLQINLRVWVDVVDAFCVCLHYVVSFSNEGTEKSEFSDTTFVSLHFY